MYLTRLNPNDAVGAPPGAWPAAQPPKVAYLVGDFPQPSETFIVAEIADHVRADLDVQVFSTGSDAAATSADELDECLRDRVTYLDAGGGPVSLIARMIAEGVRRPRSVASAVRAAIYCTRYPRTAALRTIAIAMKLSRHLPRYDVLHCHFGPRGLMGAAAVNASRAPIALVTTFHGYDVASVRFHPLGRSYAALIADADLCLTVNDLWHGELIEAGFAPDKVRVSHMGVDLAQLHFQPREKSKGGAIHLAMVGRLTDKKGHFCALEAIASLRARRPRLSVTLDCVGGGPLGETIEARIAELSLGEAVRMLGPLGHQATLDVVARADAIVLPSLTALNGDKEGIPVALMEAMALGRPVISTRHSGIPELVDEEISGLLVEESNSAQIAAAIERLADDPALSKRLAIEARSKVERDFDLKQIGVWLRRRYRNLAIARRGNSRFTASAQLSAIHG